MKKEIHYEKKYINLEKLIDLWSSSICFLQIHMGRFSEQNRVVAFELCLANF